MRFSPKLRGYFKEGTYIPLIFLFLDSLSIIYFFLPRHLIWLIFLLTIRECVFPVGPII